MLPAPARIAAAPTASSRPSWNPAVPPPPVTGGPLGVVVEWVGAGVGVRVGVGVAEELLLAVLVLVLVLLELAGMPGVLPWLELAGAEVLPAGAEPLPVLVEALEDTPGLGEGGKEDSDGDGDPDPEHAARAAVPSMVRTPQPATVSLARSAVLPIAVHTFIEPPHAPFPRPRHQKPPRKETARRPGSLPASAQGGRRRP